MISLNYMNPPSYYISKIEEILGGSFTDGCLKLTIRGNTSKPKEMLRKVRSMQRDLRIVKKEVRMVCSDINAAFDKTSNPDTGDVMIEALQLVLLKWRTANRARALANRQARYVKQEALAPYETVIKYIDQALVQLDAGKARIEDAIDRQIENETEDLQVMATPYLPPPPSTRLFVYVSDMVKGPFSLEQLQAMIADYTILLDTPCCMEGSKTWQQVLNFVE